MTIKTSFNATACSATCLQPCAPSLEKSAEACKNLRPFSAARSMQQKAAPVFCCAMTADLGLSYTEHVSTRECSKSASNERQRSVKCTLENFREFFEGSTNSERDDCMPEVRNNRRRGHACCSSLNRFLTSKINTHDMRRLLTPFATTGYLHRHFTLNI